MNDAIGNSPAVKKRCVLHFAGFEPLDAEAHLGRYARAAAQSAGAWNFNASVGALSAGKDCFPVEASGPNWQVECRIHVFEYADRIERYCSLSLQRQIAAGYLAAARVVIEGAAWRYLRHAWRFGIFFFFPFVLMTLGLLATSLLAALPFVFGLPLFHLLWSVPLALAFFRLVFLPFSDRFHMLHLFANWQMAVSLARLDDPEFGRLIESFSARLVEALSEPADEVLVTSHSMGSNLAIHALGAALENRPDLLEGRNVAFVTLGGAQLQCALLRSASRFRERVGLIAGQENVFWIDVQAKSDPVNFYGTRTLELCGYPELPPVAILAIRFRYMLTPDRYKRIRYDALRVHRQYVLGPDRRASFDFTLLTAGPFRAADFMAFKHNVLPPMSEDGNLHVGETTLPVGT